MGFGKLENASDIGKATLYVHVFAVKLAIDKLGTASKMSGDDPFGVLPLYGGILPFYGMRKFEK